MRTPRSLMLITATLAVFAMLAFAACGGDDDDNGGNSATATRSQGSGDNGGSSSTATAKPSDTGNGGSEQDILDQLSSLGGDVSNVTGKVTYKSTDSDGTTSTMTFYAKNGKSRLDSIESDGTTSSIIIETSDNTIACDPSSESCISYGSGTGGAGLGFLTLFSGDYVNALVAAAESQGINIDKSSENIAGVDAQCFSGTDSGNYGKFCFTDAGLMIYEEFNDDTGTTKLEATDVSTDVSDSDFDPPYDVTQLPSS